MLRKALAAWPELNLKCPLCKEVDDGMTHALMCCEHTVIKKLRIKRHNRVLRKILKAITMGKLKGYWVTGDLVGWKREEREAYMEGIEVEEDVEEEYNVLHAEKDQNEGFVSESEEEQAESEEENEEKKEEGEGKKRKIANQGTLELMEAEAPDNIEELMETFEERGHENPNAHIMPKDWNCKEGARRPDGLVIEGRRQGDTRQEGEVTHLIDVFV